MKTRRIPDGSRLSLPGCIRNVTVNNKHIGKPTAIHKTMDCYQESPESGVSFEHGGGYLKVHENYEVGAKEEITLEIKPKCSTGILLSSFNPKAGDFITLEIVRGSIIFRAENGDGPIEVEYIPSDSLDLLDGKWHTINAFKDGSSVRLTVDGDTREQIRESQLTSADVNAPLYVGGLPEGIVPKGVTATENFVGCMRKLVSKGGKPKKLLLSNPLMMEGNVYLGGCPYKNVEPLLP